MAQNLLLYFLVHRNLADMAQSKVDCVMFGRSYAAFQCISQLVTNAAMFVLEIV